MKLRKSILGIMICTLIGQLPVQAATYTKKVKYYKPTFYYNGVQKDLNSSVVVIDGVTYVPIRNLSNTLGLDLSWDGSNTLFVNGSNGGDLSSQMALQAKEYEIASLKKEIERLEGNGTTKSTNKNDKTSTKESYSQTQGTDILGTELTATARALEDAYEEYFDDIKFDFTVRLSSKKLRVNITYDTSSENKEFNKLSSRELKEFVEEVCEEVRERHDDIAIEGTIKNEDNNSTKYYFDYSKRDKLSCGKNSDYDRDDDWDDDVTAVGIETLLSGLTTITIDDYSGTITITDKKADVNESRERISLKVYVDLNDEMKVALNSNQGTNNDSHLKYYMNDFARRIYRDTDYDDIMIYLYSGSNEVASYDYEADKLYISGL